MLCTFESGIIYNLINWGDTNVSEYISKKFKYIAYFDIVFRGCVIFSFIIASIIYLSNST